MKLPKHLTLTEVSGRPAVQDDGIGKFVFVPAPDKLAHAVHVLACLRLDAEYPGVRDAASRAMALRQKLSAEQQAVMRRYKEIGGL